MHTYGNVRGTDKQGEGAIRGRPYNNIMLSIDFYFTFQNFMIQTSLLIKPDLSDFSSKQCFLATMCIACFINSNILLAKNSFP